MPLNRKVLVDLTFRVEVTVPDDWDAKALAECTHERRIVNRDEQAWCPDCGIVTAERFLKEADDRRRARACERAVRTILKLDKER